LTRFQFDNSLGSAILELDSNAAIISYEEYYPFGATSYQAVNSAIDVSAKRYRYTGKERDDETGFYYHGARHYAPWLARWLSCDPKGMIDGTNLYAYVRNNPMNLVDATGTQGTPPQKQQVKAGTPEYAQLRKQLATAQDSILHLTQRISAEEAVRKEYEDKPPAKDFVESQARGGTEVFLMKMEVKDLEERQKVADQVSELIEQLPEEEQLAELKTRFLNLGGTAEQLEAELSDFDAATQTNTGATTSQQTQPGSATTQGSSTSQAVSSGKLSALKSALLWSSRNLGLYATLGGTYKTNLTPTPTKPGNPSSSPWGSSVSVTAFYRIPWSSKHFQVVQSPALTFQASQASTNSSDYGAGAYAAPGGYTSMNLLQFVAGDPQGLRLTGALQARFGYAGAGGGKSDYWYGAGGATLEAGSANGLNITASAIFTDPLPGGPVPSFSVQVGPRWRFW
ncbi:MAG TPA: RHS repeat-associated core domain-containing protein, partial [Terriglobia bacterium]|nr:RHS repeat-associated core domain-containing protein [Terriglobia bacterium]